MNSLYALVIVVPDGPKLGIEIGQPGIEIVSGLIDFYHPEFSSEDDSVDEMGLAFHARLLVHGKEFSVFLVREVEEIAVLAGIRQHLSPLGVLDLHSLFHTCLVKRFDSGEPAPAPKLFRGHFRQCKTFSTVESTPRYMLTHIKTGLRAG